MAGRHDFSRVALCTLLFTTTAAHAGWYEVRNYTGTVGNAPVHVSLQTFDNLNKNESSQWRVDGSYYYDAHRVPIVLQGTRQPDGTMQLCEAAAPASFGDSPVVPKASPANPVPCPIHLTITTAGASGEWNDGKRTLPITLHQVASLDDTDGDGPHIDGAVEIPMWHHSKDHLLLGVYRTSRDCPLSMSSLRLVNIKSGKVDRDIKLDCAGTVATSIYANVYRGADTRHVTVIFQGGDHGMGDDRDVLIEP